MKQGITKCEWCLSECDNEDMYCKQCGGSVAILEPWVLQCGWCTSSNRRDLNTHCSKCGGELPSIPGAKRLPEPPKTPRKLPIAYESKVKYWKNTHFLIGAIFLLFIPTIIFPIIGFFLLRNGLKRAHAKIFSLKKGIPTRGIITKVYTDYSQHINHVHPIKIEYTFSTPKGEFHGATLSWDETNLKRPEGEHHWIVFNPENVDQNNIWPPVA